MGEQTSTKDVVVVVVVDVVALSILSVCSSSQPAQRVPGLKDCKGLFEWNCFKQDSSGQK